MAETMIKAAAELRNQITQLGLDFRLMTQFTSFVAIEEMMVNEDGATRRIEVPIELADGVRHEAVTENVQVMRLNSLGGFGSTIGPSKSLLKQVQQIEGAKSPVPAATPTQVASLEDTIRIDVEGGEQTPGIDPAVADRAARKSTAAIRALAARMKQAGVTASPDEAKFVRDGRAAVMVTLADKSEKTLAQLRNLGFEIVLNPRASGMVGGRIAIGKLAALLELKEVLYVRPLPELLGK
ncbi:MAG: hypothetical protein ACKV2V_27665 [Blastocatellia bacterium]